MILLNIQDFLLKCSDVLLQFLTTASKRTYFVYMLSSLILVYYVFRKEKRKSFLNYVLHKKVWIGKSAFVDYYFILFNSTIKVLLIAPLFIYGLKLSFETNEYLNHLFGYEAVQLSFTTTMISYTIALTIFGDFMTYILHLAMHKIPILWEFHKVHHSATTMNPFTQYRIHPLELILNNLGSIFVFGITTGVFDYLSGAQISKWTFAGVTVFTLIFNSWGANLRHSHVRLRFYNFLEYLFISPLQHQVHHSDNPAHYDKNLGSKLAIWDWLFGTLVRSEQIKKVHFGLGKSENPKYTSFLQNLLNPFKNLLGIRKS
ncbi:sterol desaturase family protein [Flavicella sediminum]|uniref:sterol desaturase family protein n=1 Tax=Flavicella sediminum TaxID=2585141 RepID=UPI001123128F|nr:sterol desaturase family protein [Flavicella sediminum]